MNIDKIEFSSIARTVNCYSGKCRPQEVTVIENITAIVDTNGIKIKVNLSKEEIEYIKQIVFARATQVFVNHPLNKALKSNVEVTNR